MKLVSTFLIIFLAIQLGTARHTVVKRGLFDWISGIWNAVASLTKGCIELYISGIKMTFDGAVKVVKIVTTEMMDATNQIKDVCKEQVTKFIDIAKSITDKAAKPYIEKFKEMLAACYAKFEQAVNDFKTKAQKCSTDFTNKLKEALDSIQKQMEAQVEVIKQQMNKMAGESADGEKVKNCIEIHTPLIQELLANNTEALKACVDTTSAKFQELFGIALEKLKAAEEHFKGFTDAGLECLQIKQDSWFSSEIAKCLGSVTVQVGKEAASLTADIFTSSVELGKTVATLIAEVTTVGAQLLVDTKSKGAEILSSFKKCCEQA